MRRATVAVLMAMAMMPAVPGGVRAQQSCAQPYEPWYRSTVAGGPDLGTSLLLAEQVPDTDGDGVADVIVSEGYDEVEINRGDGTIVVLPGSAHDFVYLGSYGPQPGDLDGDGRDELVIGVDQQGEQYLLPGTTSPGTHDIDDVGVFLEGFTNQYTRVGDQDSDGADDLAFHQGSGPGSVNEWSVYGGPELMAPGAGGSATPPPALKTYEATNLTAATMGPGAPTIITGNRSDADSLVTVHQDPAIELIAVDMTREYTGGVGRIGAFDRNGEILVSISAGDRSGGEYAVWNLSDPCSRYEPIEPTNPAESSNPSPTPSPTPASPVAGAPSYTG